MNLKKIIKEEITDFEWASDVTHDPIQYYFDNGYKSVGIHTKSNEEIKELLKNLYSLGYKWYRGSEPEYLYTGNGNLIIWVTKFLNDVNIQFSDSDFGEENKEYGDIIIDNPFII